MTSTSAPKLIDRSADRARIKARLDAQARERGFTDHRAELDDDYEQWKQRAGITGASSCDLWNMGMTREEYEA